MYPANTRKIAAAAMAGECVVGVDQTVQCLLVQRVALALADNRRIGMQPKVGQRGELGFGGNGYFSGGIEVLDPDQPFAANRAGQQTAAERGE